MRQAGNMNFTSGSRFFDTVWYRSDMGMYDKAIKWMNAKAETLPGKKADVMRQAGATKATFYRVLSENNDKSPGADVFLEWLEKLGFDLVAPEEQHCPPTVCDMGDYALVPKVRAKAGAGSSLITDGEATGMYAFRKDFLKRIGLEGNNDLVLFDVMGESMEPTILHKDTVLASKRETDPVSGQIYVIRVDDELLVKRILREPGKLIVSSDNPAHRSFEIDLAAPNPNFEIIGRVRWQGRVY